MDTIYDEAYIESMRHEAYERTPLDEFELEWAKQHAPALLDRVMRAETMLRIAMEERRARHACKYLYLREKYAKHIKNAMGGLR